MHTLGLPRQDGTNQPGNSKFIFGPSAWLRSLIKPTESYAVGYLDYKQQEFGIAAALSRDPNMIEAIKQVIPILRLQSRPAPYRQTPKSGTFFKTTALGVLYGLSPYGLSAKLETSPVHARDLYIQSPNLISTRHSQ